MIYRIFEYTSYIVDCYLILISMRILLSWFGGGANLPALRLLNRATDPYLDMFRGINFLRIGFLDFSPILGILLLAFVSNLLKVYSTGNISLSVTLFLLAQSIVYLVRSVLSLFGFISLIRIVGIYLKASSIRELWYRLDAFLQPLVAGTVGRLVPGRSIPYGTALIIFCASAFVLSWLVVLLLNPLAWLFSLIPV